MFGDFLQTFGLDFPLQQTDAQGGLLGFNAPLGGQPSMGTPAAPGGAGTGLNMEQPVTGAAKAPPPGVIAPGGGNNVQPVTAPQAPASPSPLASPLAAGGFGQPQNQPDPAPAAGVGNQFTNGKAGF